MFLEVTRRRNPALVAAAVELHGSGEIPSNCYVLDLDTIGRNAARIAQVAADNGLTCFQMTKQFGRNPVAAKVIAANGIPEVVAVDADEALTLAAAGLKLGNVGHLVQPPARRWRSLVDRGPSYATVFGFEQAKLVNDAAKDAGRHQSLLLRVVGELDHLYPGQRGGVAFNELEATIARIAELEAVSVAGVTAFPCMLFDEAANAVRPTPNLDSVLRAAAVLRRVGIDEPVVDAPSTNCVATMAPLAAAGVTHVEPGSSLIGNTPLHGFSDQPEEPAMVYVTEVTHRDAEATYTLGGGHYARARLRSALVVTENGEHKARAVPLAAEAIDYYGSLEPPIDQARPGDTVVYAFRSQVFVSRATVAAVAGIGSAPRVVGLYDHVGKALAGEAYVARTRIEGEA